MTTHSVTRIKISVTVGGMTTGTLVEKSTFESVFEQVRRRLYLAVL